MPTLHLRLLGAPQLLTSDGSPTARSGRARSLALLALAATGGPPGISRQRAMTMLWPDSDAMHARNSLRQELFQINRDLGVQPLHQDPETIRIEPDIVDVDIWKFDAAIAGNQHEAASALYGGPFMDAFYIEGADELDRWIDLQRARMRADVMRAMDAVAEQCCKHGDIRGMVLWRRRLTQLEPLSSSIALDLLRTLVAAEDRSAALKHAREHEFFVRKHLDSPPDPAFSAYVRTLRR